MKKSKVNEDLSSYYQKIGQAFLDGFKKLPYSTDRIGQSFVLKASVVIEKPPHPLNRDSGAQWKK